MEIDEGKHLWTAIPMSSEWSPCPRSHGIRVGTFTLQQAENCWNTCETKRIIDDKITGFGWQTPKF